MVTVAPGIWLVRAPNPSPLTLDGTNSYLLDAGDGRAIVVDPGPALEPHAAALIDAARELGIAIAAILVTHGHPDHAPNAALLRERTGARVYGHAGAAFPRDEKLAGSRKLQFGAIEIGAVDAPGHTFDHLVFHALPANVLFTGDVVIGTGTVVIAPPGGAMRPYQQTLQMLLHDYGHVRLILGGHGPPVDAPRAKLEEYIAHRRRRECQILDVLRPAPATLPQIVGTVYASVDPQLWPAAGRQVLAYLLALEDEGRVRAEPAGHEPSADENAILNPDFAKLANRDDVRLAVAELGLDKPLPLLRYSIAAQRR